MLFFYDYYFFSLPYSYVNDFLFNFSNISCVLFSQLSSFLISLLPVISKLSNFHILSYFSCIL